MNKINYQLITDETLKTIQEQGAKPKMLLHACCAPCASYVIEYLKEYFELTVYFYNPNISPIEEFEKRRENLVKLTDYFNVPLIVEKYDNEEYLQYVKGLENEPEHGARCVKCCELRLEKTAKKAKENGFEYFCTTLSVSPLKNAQLLNEQGEELEKQLGVKFLIADFKKRGGYQRTIELCKQLDIYRQNYCGCLFAKKN